MIYIYIEIVPLKTALRYMHTYIYIDCTTQNGFALFAYIYIYKVH